MHITFCKSFSYKTGKEPCFSVYYFGYQVQCRKLSIVNKRLNLLLLKNILKSPFISLLNQVNRGLANPTFRGCRAACAARGFRTRPPGCGGLLFRQALLYILTSLLINYPALDFVQVPVRFIHKNSMLAVLSSRVS